MAKLLDALDSAAATVVIEIKPIRHLDVTPFNRTIHDLCKPRQKVFGCRTQVTMRDLGRDGFHVSPYCADVIDKTFACALLGIPVPNPTLFQDFFHPEQTEGYRHEFPRISETDRSGRGGVTTIHGWRW